MCLTRRLLPGEKGSREELQLQHNSSRIKNRSPIPIFKANIFEMFVLYCHRMLCLKKKTEQKTQDQQNNRLTVFNGVQEHILWRLCQMFLLMMFPRQILVFVEVCDSTMMTLYINLLKMLHNILCFMYVKLVFQKICFYYLINVSLNAQLILHK